MKKIGIFSIREQFAYDLLQKINNKKKDDIKAEFALIGETKFSEKSPYRVIVDRVSSHVSYFVAYFRNAALTGSYVMNNPYGTQGVERLHNYCQAKSLGLAVPRTICLPTREYHPDCSSQDLGNLVYPLDWENIGDFIGFPAILKPYAGYGYRDIYLVKNVNDLIRCYNSTGRQVMIMQEYIPYDYIVKTFLVGGKEVCSIKDIQTEGKIVDISSGDIDPRITKAIELARRTTNERRLDFVSTEFAVKDDNIYVYNFLNPFPDCREEMLTNECYNKLLDKLAALAVEKASSEAVNACEAVMKEEGVLEPQM